MIIHVSGERERMVRSLLEAGIFATADEVIGEGLRLVGERYERPDGGTAVAVDKPEAADERTAQRLDTLRQLGRRLEELPSVPSGDGLSNRDHDRILYGR